MILGEVFPGEDAEVLVEAIKNDYSGEDEDTIQDLVVYVKQYKQTEEVATGATAVWNSNMGQYLITIPSAYVPASGIFDVCVRGSDIDDVLIRLQVNTGDAQLTAIKARTDLLTLEAINAEVDTAISDAAIVSKIDTVDTVVDGIATTLATPADFMADVSSLATSSDIQAAVAAAINADDVIRILDIIMSGTFSIIPGEGGAFTATYTGRSPDTSTITFVVDANGQRTSTTVNLV